MKRVATIILILSTIFTAKAQYLPLLGHYRNTGVFFNPAITGSNEVLALSGTYRKQWSGNKYAPHTLLFSGHTPLKQSKIAVGGFIYNDNIYITNRTGIFLNGAYRLPLNVFKGHKNGKLSFGLTAGIDVFRNNWKGLVVTDENDPELENSLFTDATPNFSFGTYYYDNKMYLSLSVPFFLENSYKSSSDLTSSLNLSQTNIFLSSGYTFDLSTLWQLQPSFMYRSKGSMNNQLDITALLQYDRMFEFGLTYRTSSVISAILGVQLNPQFGVSYSYDYSTNRSSIIRNSNHEISLSYEFKYVDKSDDPRFF